MGRNAAVNKKSLAEGLARNVLASKGELRDKDFRRALLRLKRSRAEAKAALAHINWRGTEADGPIYAIGDIHGSIHLLDELLDKIERDAAAQGKKGLPARIVFLGDMINRGPDSRQVVERLLTGPAHSADQWLVLRGNHEQALLDALGDDSAFDRFLMKGGVQTMHSYGIDRKHMTRKTLRQTLPKRHLAFLQSLPLTCRTDTHLYVHAGLRPGRKLKEQSSFDLMNMREPFLSDVSKFPWTVVHGHTPTVGHPVEVKGRICVDTGACVTGVLTAAVIFDDEPVRFLSALAK